MTVRLRIRFRTGWFSSVPRPTGSTIVVGFAALLAAAVTVALVAIGLVATRDAGAMPIWSWIAAFSMGIGALIAAAAWATLRQLRHQSRRIAELLEGHPEQNAVRAQQAAAARYAASLSPQTQIMELGVAEPRPRPSLVLVTDAAAPDRSAARRL